MDNETQEAPKAELGQAILDLISSYSDTGITVGDVLGALEVAKFTVVHDELEVLYATDLMAPNKKVN